MDYFETRDNYYDSETTFSNTAVRTILDPTAPMYQFYKGLNIFLTGASGFMGKVFIEKVLRCYPEVGAIYILMRPKKNKTVQERIEEQFKDELFDRVKREQSDILQRKVHFISGDLNQPLLGISCSDQDLIRTRVHVIVHAAASLRMDELVKDAFTLNVEATKQLLELATQCTQLKAFVHVSTLYTHSYRFDFEEKFYPTRLDYEEIQQLIELTSSEEIEILTPILFSREYNNTYAFTKAMGESVVEKYLHRLPLSMVRPSIVASTWKEPIVGWVNNMYGPGGVTVGAALGVIRTFYAEHDKKCDLIPVDVAINMIVGVIWKTALDHETKRGKEIVPIEPPVYNLSTSGEHPITWLEYMVLNREAGLREEYYVSSTLPVWHYAFTLEQYKIVYLLRVWFLHMIPGMIIDAGLRYMNMEPRLMKIYVKVMKFSKYFYPYVERDWDFSTRNVKSLLSQIPSQDLLNVDYSMRGFTWQDYMVFYFRGGKLYVMRDTYDNMDKGRTHMRRLKYIHYTLLIILGSLFTFILYKLFCPYSSTMFKY
uniref:Fatty acyl-CoA reductase n=1 Tax=Cacopsylla melanoneura TaxID=428564 RepID=A0A8D8WTF8_9HEMI